MPKYKVHVYREMRLVFNDIEAASPERAALIARERHFHDCDDCSDCEGGNLAALVDHAPHAGTLIRFEAGRLLDTGAELVQQLHEANEVLERLFEKGELPDLDVRVILENRAAIAKATGAAHE